MPAVRREQRGFGASIGLKLWVILTWIAAMTPTPAHPAEPLVTLQSVSPRTYELVEFVVATQRAYENPHDPELIAIDADFISPAGQRLSIPGFWWEPSPGDPGAAGFRVRFAPPVAGNWNMTVTARDRTGERRSASIPFEVLPGSSRGFIARSPDSRQYFQYSDGSAYFPVGINIAWVHGDDAQSYDRWFEKLSQAGGNFARVWMCHRPVYLESEKSGLGRFDPQSAAYFDRVLELGQKHGIAVMLCFLNHREFLDRDMWGEADWPKHVYNAATGGPATRPADFFTHPLAQEHFKRRLRYIVARYAAYTSLAFWELINEQEFIPGSVPDEWNCQMAAFLKSLDPYRRPVTTSAHCPPGTWECPDIDLTQSHLYGDGTVADGVNPIIHAITDHRRFNKPHFVAEYGISYKGPDREFDPHNRGTALHNSLWASAIGGAAGTAAYWWWDNYIDPQDQWHHYAPITKFAARIDWPRRNFLPLTLPPPELRDPRNESHADLVLDCTQGFVRSHGQIVTISPNGVADRPLPRFQFGPHQPTLRTPTRLLINMPTDGEMILRVGEISDFSMLRVWVDEKPAADFAFSALPGSPDLQETELKPHLNGIYQGRIDKDCRVPLSAGRHAIQIANLAGDWVTIQSITFTRARSSRFDNLAAIATRDEPTGETLIWLYDLTSNWKADLNGVEPKEHRGISLKVPWPDTTSVTVEWWDTRQGLILRTDVARAADGMLDLSPPVFKRDIALRLRAAQ